MSMLNRRFLLDHPAHLIALGFGSGLSAVAPGTVGTMWAWVMYVLIQPLFTPLEMGWFILFCTLIGWWACTVTAQHLGVADPEARAFCLTTWLPRFAPCW